MAVAFLVGIWIARRRAARSGYDPDVVIDLSVVIILASILGARLAYVLVRWEYYQHDLASRVQARRIVAVQRDEQATVQAARSKHAPQLDGRASPLRVSGLARVRGAHASPRRVLRGVGDVEVVAPGAAQHRANRLGRTAAPADHAAHIVGRQQQ